MLNFPIIALVILVVLSLGTAAGWLAKQFTAAAGELDLLTVQRDRWIAKADASETSLSRVQHRLREIESALRRDAPVLHSRFFPDSPSYPLREATHPELYRGGQG